MDNITDWMVSIFNHLLPMILQTVLQTKTIIYVHQHSAYVVLQDHVAN